MTGALPRPALTLGTWAHSHIALASFLCHGHPSRLASILGHEGRRRQLFPPFATSPPRHWGMDLSQYGSAVIHLPGRSSFHRQMLQPLCLPHTDPPNLTNLFLAFGSHVSVLPHPSLTPRWDGFRPVSGWGRRVWAGILGDCLNGGYTFLTWPLQFLCCIFVFEAY